MDSVISLACLSLNLGSNRVYELQITQYVNSGFLHDRT
jgi:hypothetical protein